MKNLWKPLLFALVATATVYSCSKEVDAPVDEQPVSEPVTNVVKFKAEITDPSTKATLEANAEDTKFLAAWENASDKINLVALSDLFNDEAPAEWDESEKCFVASFTSETPTVDEDWEYEAIYPYVDGGNIPFGSERTQNGNAYNSAFDVMYGTQSYSGTRLGKDEEGENFVIPMNRLTGIAYFHITGGPDEDVVSATLSVQSGNIAANSVSVASGAITPTGATNSITITFPEQAPNAQDFKLWFNVLPTTYERMSLTVETATKTFTISKKSSGEYVAGKLYKVKKAVSWTDKGSEPGKTYAYKKISSQLELTNGSYLIVNEDYSFAVAGSKTSTNMIKGGAGTNVQIVGDVIAYSADLALDAFEINSVPGGYSIKGSKCGYIGYSNTANNGLQGNSTTVYVNNISVAEGIATITTKNGQNTTYTLCCNPNSSSPIVKYYKSVANTYKPISLYKYQAVDASIPTQYNVNIVSVTGGTLSATPSQAEAGAKVTLTATPNPGYAFNKWIVTNEKTLEEITVKGNEFTMPAANVRVSASFTQTGAGATAPASITIDSKTENFPSKYGSANTFSEYTLNGLKYKIQQVYVNGEILQWRAFGNDSGTGTMYNSEAMPAGIASIVITFNSSDSNKNHTVKIGNSANPTSATSITPTNNNNIYTYTCDGSSKYFVITNGTGAGYIDSIVINFE